jgi:hypothetical protein
MSIIDLIKRFTFSPKVEFNEQLGFGATKSKVKLKKSTAQNVAGRDVNVTNATAAAPIIFLQLDGDPAKNGFGGFIKNLSQVPLIASYIEIAGVRTDLELTFTKLCPLEHPNYPEDVLLKPFESIPIVVRYRTLTGETYELVQQGSQQFRVGDNKYNVLLPGPPTIRAVSQ